MYKKCYCYRMPILIYCNSIVNYRKYLIFIQRKNCNQYYLKYINVYISWTTIFLSQYKRHFFSSRSRYVKRIKRKYFLCCLSSTSRGIQCVTLSLGIEFFFVPNTNKEAKDRSPQRSLPLLCSFVYSS